jgi:hypothetical protein
MRSNIKMLPLLAIAIAILVAGLVQFSEEAYADAPLCYQVCPQPEEGCVPLTSTKACRCAEGYAPITCAIWSGTNCCGCVACP